MSLKKRFINNIIHAFVAQSVSITVSLVMTLGIPKILSLNEYGYWQLFIFYTGFIGFFQFGLSDGIYLKYGGRMFSELDKKVIKSELLYGVGLQFLISLIIITILITDRFAFHGIDSNRFLILLMASFFILIGNAITLLGFLLLATNDIKYYSKSVLFEKIAFIVFLLMLILLKEVTVLNLIILFLTTKISALAFLSIAFRKYLSTGLLSFSRSARLIKTDMSTGIILMMSNIASTLILGIGRFIIDKEWDIQTFGKISLSLSATYFFLLLISQISLSLFPVLRQLNFENQKSIFIKSSQLLTILMLGVFLLYFPLIGVLSKWIPRYIDSFKYLIILMPICLFEGKMQMIYNTYMKSLNRQKALLVINIGILLLCLVLTSIAGFLFHNLLIVLYSMLVCIATRSVITQLYLYKFYNLKMDSGIGVELFFAFLFIIAVSLLDSLYAFLVYSTVYAFFILLIRKRVFGLVEVIFRKKGLGVSV